MSTEQVSEPRLPLVLVAVQTWVFSEDYEEHYERLVLPVSEGGEPSWDNLPVAQGAYVFDDALDAGKTMPGPAPAGAPIGRIIARAPVLADGNDAPMWRWDLDPLLRQLHRAGLDPKLVEAQLDTQELRRLRFGAIRAPFFSVPSREGSAPTARGMITAMPLAENILVEVEHRRVLFAGELDPITYHRMDPHPVWRSELGNAAGLAAAVGLRALTTLDRARMSMRSKRTDLEHHLFELLAEEASDARDGALRTATAQLLDLVAETGITRDALSVSLRLACAQDPDRVESYSQRRFLETLTEHQRDLGELRTDAREIARIASDAASTLTLIEEQAGTRRGEAFRRTLTIVTAVILLPGLVAAVFSAKVKLPAEETGRGTLGLLSAMIAFAALTAWALNLSDVSQRDTKAIQPASQAVLLGLGVIAASVAVVAWLA